LASGRALLRKSRAQLPKEAIFIGGQRGIAWTRPKPGTHEAAISASPTRSPAVARSTSSSCRAVRGGLHTGEIELKGDDIGGIAVNIAARVAAMPGPGETLVSSTVRDLVAGSGLRFEDRGHHALKGLPEDVRLYAALSNA
jgi:class 3 adenylate cyclase